MEPAKRTRKPKTVKEEHSNIDSITFENTEKDINYKEVLQLEETKVAETKEPKEPKEKKPKKISIPRKKKETIATVNNDNINNIIKINTLESLLNNNDDV